MENEKWKMENGKWNFKVKHSLCIVILLSASFYVQADNWQAYIDKNINVDGAQAVVNQYEPIIRCNGSSTPDAQSCYSTPSKVIVVDANSGQIAGYEIGHSNQNSPSFMMEKYVTSIEVPSTVANLITNTLDAYDILDDTAEAVTSNKLTAASSSSGNCDSNSATAKAVRAIYDGRVIDEVNNKVQQEFDRRFSSLTLKDFSFNVSQNGASVSGTFTFDATTKTVYTRFGAVNSDFNTGNNIAAYDLTVKNNSIHLTVNEARTKFDGLSLNRIKAIGITSVSDCLIKELNKYMAASVASYNNGSDGDAGGSLPVGWNRIPVTSGGGNIQSDQCVWTFFVNGQPFLQILGSCP